MLQISYVVCETQNSRSSSSKMLAKKKEVRGQVLDLTQNVPQNVRPLS